MKFYPTIRLACPFEVVETDGVATAVSLGEYNGVIKLKSESARFMFEKLQTGLSVPELIKACMDRYPESSVEEIGPRVMAFLDELKEKNLLWADMTDGLGVEDNG